MRSSFFALYKVKRLLGIDRAVSLTVFGRMYSALTSAVTVIIVSRLMSPIEQGYYYAIWSLWSLQTIFELGFSFVILQAAAHESAHLIRDQKGCFIGDTRSIQRLAHLLKTIQRWYLTAALIMVVSLYLWGYHFFSTKPNVGIHWHLPWVLTVLAAGLMFQIDPTVSFMEGCGYVSDVAMQKTIQSVVGSFVAWSCIATHHGLYAPGLLIMVQAGTGVVFFYRHRHFLLQIWKTESMQNTINWRQEIFPFQWRVALTWLSNYIPSILFTPLLFSVSGPVIAGQMGLSININLSLGLIALSWMSTKAAPFGTLVAKGEIQVLDRLFFKTLRQSTALVTLGAVTAFAGILLLNRYVPSVGHRMLSPSVFVFLLIATICNHIVQSEALYLRSYKKEPFLYMSVSIAGLMALCSWYTAHRYGVHGIALSYFSFSGVLSLLCGSAIFFACRHKWKKEYEAHV